MTFAVLILVTFMTVFSKRCQDSSRNLYDCLLLEHECLQDSSLDCTQEQEERERERERTLLWFLLWEKRDSSDIINYLSMKLSVIQFPLFFARITRQEETMGQSDVLMSLYFLPCDSRDLAVLARHSLASILSKRFWRHWSGTSRTSLSILTLIAQMSP